MYVRIPAKLQKYFWELFFYVFDSPYVIDIITNLCLEHSAISPLWYKLSIGLCTLLNF